MNQSWKTMIGLATILFVATATSRAEEISNAELLARIEMLEAERDQLSQFASYSMGDQAAAHKADEYGKLNVGGECVSSEWYAAYELTVLRPFVGNANFIGTGFGDDYGYGHRFTLGYESNSDIGVRARYWFYNHGHDVVPPVGLTSQTLDMDVADLELTLSEQFANWDLMVSGGVRYGRLGINFLPFGAHVDFEGFGPTVALEAARRVGCRGLYVVGNFRSSLLIGEISNPDFLLGTGGGLVPSTVDDEVTVVLENQLGVGWTRGILDLRAVWETQFWMNDTFADDFNGLGTNYAFGGLALQAELRY